MWLDWQKNPMSARFDWLIQRFEQLGQELQIAEARLMSIERALADIQGHRCK